jgi:hypothetical protein
MVAGHVQGIGEGNANQVAVAVCVNGDYVSADGHDRLGDLQHPAIGLRKNMAGTCSKHSNGS